MPRQKRWFIECEDSDAHTNAVCAENLAEESAGLKLAEHGKCVRVWECSLEQRGWFLRNKTSQNLKFVIWFDKKDGKLKKWAPLKPRAKNLRLVPDLRPRRETLYVQR